jgi:hypothetical protein
MLRRLPLLLVLAWAIPSCERRDEEPWPPSMPPAPTSRYAFQDPRTTVWRVFEGDGRGDFRPCVQAVPGGLIEWTSGSVVGEGRGLAKGAAPQDGLMARRAARLLAARNALLAASGIDCGPGGTFQNVSGGTIRLDAVIRDFQEIRSDFDPATRTATSAVRIPLYGARGVVRIAGLQLRPPAKPWDWPAGPGEPPEPTEAKVIVVDLRGAPYRPALLPRFLTPDGRCVFDAAELGEEELAWRPAATHLVYAPAKDKPHRLAGFSPPDPLAGAPPIVSERTDDFFEEAIGQTFSSRPLVLSRCQAGAQPGTIVLSEKAVEYLRHHPQTRQLFRAGKVVIVLSAPHARGPRPG